MSDQPKKETEDLAADVIRDKISHLYEDEPNAKAEAEVAEAATHRSKHEQYMHNLTTSGKPLAEIQTAWHNYYNNLSDKEKHEVWEEFYKQHKRGTNHQKSPDTAHEMHKLPHETEAEDHKNHQLKGRGHKRKNVAELKHEIAHRSSGKPKLSKKHHIKSVVFGLSMGAFVVLIMMFGLFNERFIAPFITPSKTVSNAPIIIDPNSATAGKEPEIIIPKINVEIPVVYNAASSQEADMQRSLEDGVVHYPDTPKPGENGNAVIVGHSSNNIFNSGKYKFAFVLLKQLDEGDVFYLNRGGTRYAYKVYEKKIVAPTEVSVLQKQSRKATATLITCDPPGTSRNRLIVVGEQISPSTDKNKKSTAQVASTNNSVVPGNAPTLWSRFTGWLFD